MATDKPLELVGAEQLKKILSEYPYKVEKRVARVGMKKAAARLKTFLVRAAPVKSGMLKKSIRIGLSKRYPTVWVSFRWPGPDNRESYFGQVGKDTKFFEATIDRYSTQITQMMEEEVINALYKEAGIAYAKSKRLK